MLLVVVGLSALGSGAQNAAADPPKRRQIDVPDADREQATQALGKRLKDPTTGAPAMGGGWSAGMVIDPGPLADAQPYPRGMVIAPPDPGDRMVIPPGERGLPGPQNLAERLVHGLDRGVSSVLELVMPRHL